MTAMLVGPDVVCPHLPDRPPTLASIREPIHAGSGAAAGSGRRGIVTPVGLPEGGVDPAGYGPDAAPDAALIWSSSGPPRRLWARLGRGGGPPGETLCTVARAPYARVCDSVHNEVDRGALP